MSGDDQLSAGETSFASAFARCATEPIHIPGAIQPQGALLAALADGLIVTHASENLAQILGRSAEAVLGRPLQEAVGAVRPGRAWTLLGPEWNTLHLLAHRQARHLCIDILPAHAASPHEPALVALTSVLEAFRHVSGRQELCELAVRGLRDVTGYDRVIAYRFDREGHGEVIAEALADNMESYLGLRFPATDVPPQARRLYVRQRIGTVADCNYCPVPLVADPGHDDGSPLDLTHSVLRSVSAVHLEYMRNMKTTASLRISLVRGEDLWGVLLCHHATARVADPDLMAAADIVGQVVSLLLGSLGEAETYARQLDRGVALHTLIDRLAAPAPLAEALAASEAELLHLVDAGGAMVRVGGISRCVGRTPPESVAERVLAVLLPGADDQPRALDDLGLRHPEFADYAGDASGALVLPLGRNSGDGILWFRPERSRTVVWGGDPAGHGAVDPVTGQLTPRASFAAWRETMSGHSAPWCEADILLAGELRRPLDDQVAQRTKAELVKLRCYDELTGLPNWNLLRDWLTAAAREPAAGAALLLIDLGQMKEVNETLGFGAGDALLVEAARRLLVLAEPDNLAARLGGAEFAMLLRRSDRNTGAAFGERIRLALAAPYTIGGRSVEVSPTVRMLFADMGDELGLLGAVDAARAEAKARIVAQRGVETQRQKMEALGRMMGGVAHELNNMLQPIALLGQTIQKKGLFVAEGAEHLGIMLDCTRKARQIISELLAFSRPTARSSEFLDAATLLRDTLNLVVNAISPGISVSTHVAAQPLSVRVNRTAFAQIVVNLATNAAAAMGGQGTLTISLDEDVGAAGEIAAQASPAAARLCVSDTGCGMTKATLDRAFEPFFTTKAVGEGTGLGLPVVYGLVKEMGGTIALASEPGVGTTVTILIPAADGER